MGDRWKDVQPEPRHVATAAVAPPLVTLKREFADSCLGTLFGKGIPGSPREGGDRERDMGSSPCMGPP